jgi:amino acid transporter
MRWRDLVLFCVVTGLSIRWVSTAAAAGPAAITIWIAGWLVFYIPLLAAVLELATRFREGCGGVYDWSGRALGPWAGFMTGWTYWTSVLPYYPSLLLFAAGAAAFLLSRHPAALLQNRAFAIGFSISAMWLATALNIVGLRIGKWLHNLGALGNWGPAAILVALAIVAARHAGSATNWTPRAFVPHASIREAVSWTTIAFALAGSEASAFVLNEVTNARRVFAPSLLLSGVIIMSGYIAGTAALLIILPAHEISGFSGIMETVVQAAERAGWAALIPLAAVLLVVANIGAVGAWLTATARLPFVAGLDRYLPPAFGALHQRWGTPYVAFLWQAAIVTGVILLSQAGSTVAHAYDTLVSMSIIAYFLPYVFTFVSVLRVQSAPADRAVIRPPGGRPTAVLLASTGLVVTVSAIVLACLPDPVKIVGCTLLIVGVGQLLYWRAHRAGTTTWP